jgi:hypothetical protein
MRYFVAVLAVLPFTVFAKDVSKAQWTESIEKNMPIAFCTSQTYFRQCHTVTVRECEAAAVGATKDCLDKHGAEIPATLTLPQDGRKWGEVVGRCAGTATELALIKKRVTNNAKCSDPSQWQ